MERSTGHQTMPPTTTLLRRGLATQLRVIGALILRDLRTRFGRLQLGYLWAIAEPLSYVVFMAALFTGMGRHPPFGSDNALFFATGILPFTVFATLSRSGSAAIEANRALLTYPIVKPVDALIARGVLEFATSLMVMIVMFGGIVIFLNTDRPAHLDTIASAILGLALLGFGVGMTNSAIEQVFPTWREIYSVVSRPLMLVCAVFFTLESLPASARDLAAYIPVTHGVELFRAGYYSGYRSSVLDVAYLYEIGLLLCLIGLAGERALRIGTAAEQG
jgi:capsular polysaccharide transport system permease protein